MKRTIQLVAIIVFPLLSCKKNISSKGNSNMLIGKWNILSDSSFSGVGPDNHAVNFAGGLNDYFDFEPNGKLFIKKNGNLNVLSYTLISGSAIIIDSFLSESNGTSDTCSITGFTKKNVIIGIGFFATPGGIIGRKVHLIR